MAPTTIDAIENNAPNAKQARKKVSMVDLYCLVVYSSYLGVSTEHTHPEPVLLRRGDSRLSVRAACRPRGAVASVR
jgi:hypothetical protein